MNAYIFHSSTCENKHIPILLTGLPRCRTTPLIPLHCCVQSHSHHNNVSVQGISGWLSCVKSSASFSMERGDAFLPKQRTLSVVTSLTPYQYRCMNVWGLCMYNVQNPPGKSFMLCKINYKSSVATDVTFMICHTYLRLPAFYVLWNIIWWYRLHLILINSYLSCYCNHDDMLFQVILYFSWRGLLRAPTVAFIIQYVWKSTHFENLHTYILPNT